MVNPADLIQILTEFRRLKSEIHDWKLIYDHVTNGTKLSDALKQKMLGDKKLAGIDFTIYKQDYIQGEKLFGLQQAYEQQAYLFCQNIDDALAALTNDQKKLYAKELNDIGAIQEKNKILKDAYKCY